MEQDGLILAKVWTAKINARWHFMQTNLEVRNPKDVTTAMDRKSKHQSHNPTSYRFPMTKVLPFPGNLSHCRTNPESHRFLLHRKRLASTFLVTVAATQARGLVSTHLSVLGDPNPSKTRGCRISP